MPNRILREGILESERIHKISPMAELFYRRLMSVLDDYGRYACDIPVLLSRCFPRRPSWADEDTVRLWIGECHAARLLDIYLVGDHLYIQVFDFNQPTRSRSKCPEYTLDCVATATQMTSICDLSLTLSRSDRNTNTHTNTNSEHENAREQKIAITKPPVDEWFVEFWALYWRRVDRANALKAFRKYATDEETKDRIIAAVKAQTPQYAMRESDKRPHAATWLNGRRYEEDPEIYQPPMSKLDRIMERI